MELNKEQIKKKKGIKIRDEKKRHRSEGKTNVNGKNVLAEGKTDLKE